MEIVLKPFTNQQDWLQVERIQQGAYSDELQEDIDKLKLKNDIPGAICRLAVLMAPTEKGGTSAHSIRGEEAVMAYVLSHPFNKASVPPLNADITEYTEGTVKENERNLFLHDFCLCESMHGKGLGKTLVQQYLKLAQTKGFSSISLVAVQSSQAFWRGAGFSPDRTSKSLNCYGKNAAFMTRDL